MYTCMWLTYDLNQSFHLLSLFMSENTDYNCREKSWYKTKWNMKKWLNEM